MRIHEWPFLDAAAIVAGEKDVGHCYDEIVAVLSAASPVRQSKLKARPEFIFSQTATARELREALGRLGWSHGRVLANEADVGGVHVSACRADMLKPPVHTILEFGNRASYGLNLVSRVPLAMVRADIRLTVMVTPTDRFGRELDTNLAVFERVAGEILRLVAARPETLAGPLMVIGVEPE